jgi:putative SOS response-associated peptidase YedK
MCTLYADIAAKEAHERIFGVENDFNATGNLAPMPVIFPDGIAPVVFKQDGKRQMANMRWGFPGPPNAGNRPVVNVRNTASGFWKPWLKPEQRALIPATSFSEWTDSTPKVIQWFALSDDRPLFAFAGIWRKWTGERGTVKDRVSGEHILFSFLTTDAGDDVRPIHSKAMPVILRTEEEWSAWLEAPVAEALSMQRPLPGGSIKIVASGERKDAGLNVGD